MGHPYKFCSPPYRFCRGPRERGGGYNRGVLAAYPARRKAGGINQFDLSILYHEHYRPVWPDPEQGANLGRDDDAVEVVQFAGVGESD